MWSVPNMWEGGECWILGGGPSMTGQFDIPESVVKDVRDGVLPPSAYSPYLSAIHNKHTIGINVAYLIGNWIDIMFFGDNGFYLAHRERLRSFPNIKAGCSINIHQYACDGIKGLVRMPNKRFGISDNRKTVVWNGNSGAAAISLAVHTGVKRIVLVGFDMKLQDNAQHWHQLYGIRNYSLPTIIKGKVRELPFNRHLTGFPEIAKDARKKGVEIINASPDSAITAFPKVTVKSLL